MTKKHILLVLTIFLLIPILNINVSASNSSKIEDKSSCIIVKYSFDIEKTVDINGIKNREFLTENIELIEFEDATKISSFIEEIQQYPNIEYAHPNFVFSTVSDEYYRQWGLKNDNPYNAVDINIEPALKVVQGTNNISIGVIDTGIDIGHSELLNSVRNDGYNFVDDTTEIYTDISSDTHGTAVAGVIAACFDGDGINGVLPDAKILPLKAFDGSRGYTSDIIKAIKYAQNKNITIINCSFVSYDYNSALYEVMKNSNILFVCAAGNDGENVDVTKLSYPACFAMPNIISVAAINSEGKLTKFSNYGDSIDILAPGEQIYSCSPGQQYYSYGGTSMSAAYVTGVAALLKSQYTSMPSEEIATRIISTAKKYTDYSGVVNSLGIVDAYAALTNTMTISDQVSSLVKDDETDSIEYRELANQVLFSINDDIEETGTAIEIEPIVAQTLHYGESGVNPASGNFSFSMIDFEDETPEGKFVFERYYNSLDQKMPKAFGCGWSSIFDSNIQTDTKNQELIVTMPNGSQNTFCYENGVYTSITTRNIVVKNGDYEYIMTTPDNYKYIFKSENYSPFIELIEIWDKTNSKILEIEYEFTGKPKCFYDSVGRKYTVEVKFGDIRSITDPYGRKTVYNIEDESIKLLKSVVDTVGNETFMIYMPRDYANLLDGEYSSTDMFLCLIATRHFGTNSLEFILEINYELKSHQPDYGKVISYTDAFGEIYKYDYQYMYTEITRDKKATKMVEYYDSYMYVYKTDYEVSTNDVAERRFYRPNGNNYGEVSQEMSNCSGDWYTLTTYERDPDTGNVLCQINDDGGSINYWYDDNNNLIGMLDEEDNCTLYVYNDNNLLTCKALYKQKGFPEIEKSQIEQYISDNEDLFSVERYSYADGSNFGCPYSKLLVQFTDAVGNVTAYSYDKFGNLTSKTKPYKFGENVENVIYEYYVNYIDLSDSTSIVNTKSYSDFVSVSDENMYMLGFENKIISPLGVIETYYYDNNGMQYKYSISDGTNELVTRDVYDPQGHKLKEITADAYSKNNCYTNEVISNYFVNESGMSYYYFDFVDSDGEYPYATEYTYQTVQGDGYNQIESITYPEINNLRDTTYYKYEKDNIVQETDPSGQVYLYEYNQLDSRIVSSAKFTDLNSGKTKSLRLNYFSFVSQYYDGSFLIRKYTLASFVRCKENHSMYTISTHNLINFRNNLTSEYSIEDEIKIEYKNIYNKNGTLSINYNNNGNIVYYEYDSLNRVTEEWEAIDSYNGSTLFKYTKYEYYDDGTLKKEYICSCPVKLPLDENEQITDNYNVFRTLYKKDGSLVSESDYVITSYTYCSDGNVKSLSVNNGSLTEYEYDSDGNIITEIINGSKITYEYNYFGEPISKKEYVAKDSVILDENDNYVIDGDYAILITQYVYQHGQLVQEIRPDGTSIYYEYDGLGRQTAVAQEGYFVNSEGQSIYGISKTVTEYDWEDKVSEERIELIVGGVTHIVRKTVYHPKENAHKISGGTFYYLVFKHKVETIEYDFDGVETDKKTTVYYKDLYDRLIMEITPDNYKENGVVTADILYSDTFSEDENEMNRTEYQYDILGRLHKVIERYRDPNNNNEWKKVVKYTYSYDDVGNVTQVIDALGNSTKYVYNLADKVYLEKDAEAVSNKYSFSKKYLYDVFGRVIKETDGNRNDTNYLYNDINNSVTKTNLVSKGDTSDVVTEYNQYDNNGNLVETYIGSDEAKITYKYNQKNQQVEAVALGDATISQCTTLSKYDSMGNLVTKQTGTNRLEVFEYDTFGNAISHTISDLSGAQAVTTTKLYDVFGNVRFETDGNNNITEYKYDVDNNVIAKICANSVYNTYDSNGNVLTQTDWLGNTSTYTYDPLGRLIKVVDPYGTISEQLYYNDNDCQILSVDACGNQTVFEYDKNNRLISTTDAMLNKSGSVYDRAGLLVSEYDGNGNTVNYAYDELGRLISSSKTVNNIDETVSYTYDNRSNLTSQTNGEGHTTTYVYNVADKLASKIDHNGAGDSTKTENYTYDERGNLVSKTDRNGQTLTYVYDVHNRLTDTKYCNDILISNTYDNNGNIITTVDQSGTTIRTFDSLNRTLTENISDIGTKTYQYDITDNVDNGYVINKITDPYNNVTVKIFDKSGRLYMVKSAENAQPITYEYNANGTVSKITNPDGTYTQYVYNADNTIAEMTNYSSSADVLDKYTYTYDCAKNQISKTETISGVSVGTTTFAYDEADRLVSVTEPSGKITQYTYDKVGNRVKQSVTENDITVDTTYTYNEQERLLNSTSTSNNVTYQICYNYDNNGNLFSKTQNIIKPYNSEVPDVVLSVLGVDAESDFDAVYEYNVLNQLVNVYQGDTTITNTYNGDGLRVSQTINGDTTKYVYDQGNVICEANNDNTFRNVFGLRLHLREEDGNTYAYRYNGHGDVMVVTSGDGTTVASYYYDPFGIEISSAQSIHNPYRYCGEYYDSDTGLIYLRARYYDPSVGRFISEDPIRDGLNWYVYCDNNPILYFDPSGLEDIVVAGGAYHEGEGAYQYEFVDSALLQISRMDDGATLLVANAGWTNEQYNEIVKAAQDRNINLLWFSTIDSLTNYINNGRDRKVDPITSFYVFAHGTDSGTGEYSITFGLYTKKDAQLRWYTSDISKISPSAFKEDAASIFYACRTGNTFNNGNFARTWAWITGSKTKAYAGLNGRTQYSDILGSPLERRLKTKSWSQWNSKRGNIIVSPGEAYKLPTGSNLSSIKTFSPMTITSAVR